VPLPLDGAPLEPAHEHSSGSGTQLNPAPQLASLAQGSWYRGVHVLMATVVQSEGGWGGVGGTMQSVFGGQSGAGAVLASPAHVVITPDSKQTMPSAQSLWALQDAGAHSLICVALQGGGSGHGWPSGQAKPGQVD